MSHATCQAVDNYVVSIRYHRKFKENALRTKTALQVALGKCTSDTASIALLKTQIQMRVLGCGWHE